MIDDQAGRVWLAEEGDAERNIETMSRLVRELKFMQTILGNASIGKTIGQLETWIAEWRDYIKEGAE